MLEPGAEESFSWFHALRAAWLSPLMVSAGGMVPVAENCSFLNHIPSWAAVVAAMNSASVVDRAVADAWILDAHEMAPPWLRKT